jgi:5-methyltetrahydropteroyltriglutamate--homocysteine methyltransferase
MKVTNNGSFPWRGTPLGEELERLRPAPGTGGAVETAWREARDRVARQAVAAQAQAGCDLVTDGLARRDEPVAEAVTRLEGVEAGPEKRDAGGRTFRVPIVRSEVAWKEPLLVEDYLFAASGSEARVKVVLTGPFTVAQRAEDHAYGDPMALGMALAFALNKELRALQAAGCDFVQVDEPDLLAHADAFPIFTRIWEVLGRGIGATLAIHLEGGSIAPIATGLGRLKRLGCLSVDCVSHPENLDAAAGAPLHEGALLSLGVVSARAGEGGDAGAIAERLAAVAGLPDPSRLLVGPAADLGALSFQEATERIGTLAAVRRRFGP